MLPRQALWLTLAIGLVAAAEARAHFLFIRIGPLAEAGRSAEVYFSEQADAGDPRFIDKVAHTQLWLQRRPGQFQPLKVQKGVDRLRAIVPPEGTIAVVGQCEYGVLARPKQTPFLLRYFPKALAGHPEELNRLSPRQEIPFEIMATFENDTVRLVVLENGKPQPNAVFHTVDVDLNNEEVKAGSTGEARWKPPASGTYSVYTQRTLKRTGENAGKAYEEIREFATLAFTWPLERTGADPEAVSLFEDALGSRAQWKQFPGFTARVEGSLDGRPFTGKVTVEEEGLVQVEMEESAARSWAQGQLESIVMHRLASAHEPAAKPVLRFADEADDHPLGRLLVFDKGQFASSYRIKDRQITVVNRHMGRTTMTITTLNQERNRDGQYLPLSYVVQSWDADSGGLRRVETVQDRWTRVGPFDLPSSHTVTAAVEGGLGVRSFSLSDHALTRPGTAGGR